MQSSFRPARPAVLAACLCVACSVHAQLDAPQLKEVVVTASRFPESAASLPYGVSVITARELETSGAISVSDAVSRLLGIRGRLDTTGGNNPSLDLRGFGVTAEQNQVVIIDGRRINEQDLSSPDLGAIAIENVEKIEVIRGNAAVLYGEGATGGAIVVTTKSGAGVERKNQARIALSLGTYGTREERASASMASGELSVDVAASDRVSNGHRENFASNINNLAASVQWNNDVLRVGVQTGRNLLHSGTPGGLSQAQFDTNAYQANASYRDATLQIKSENTGFFAEYFAGPWQVAFDAGQRTKKYDSQSSVNGAYVYDVDANSASLKARHQWSGTSLGNTFMVGADANEWMRTVSPATRTKAQTDAVFATDDVQLLATGTRFALGVRSENLKKLDVASAVELKELQQAWHFGVTQDLMKDWQIYGRTGQSYRLGTVDEFTWIPPGTTLKPQTSRDLEFGTRYRYGSGRVELRWYRSDLVNEIGYDPTATAPFGTGANVNLDPTQHQGVEVEWRQNLSQTVTVRLDAANRTSRSVSGPFTGNDIALVPGQTAALGATWSVAEGHTVDVALGWVSSQKVDFQNQCTLNGYSTVDAQYSYQSKSFDVLLGIRNLTDTKYATNAASCVGTVVDGLYLEPGRAVTVTAKLKF